MSQNGAAIGNDYSGHLAHGKSGLHQVFVVADHTVFMVKPVERFCHFAQICRQAMRLVGGGTAESLLECQEDFKKIDLFFFLNQIKARCCIKMIHVINLYALLRRKSQDAGDARVGISIWTSSIDQVMHEMITRFDWANQMADEVFRRSAPNGSVKTYRALKILNSVKIVVFNPHPWVRSDILFCSIFRNVETPVI